jgi:hypothetical protein
VFPSFQIDISNAGQNFELPSGFLNFPLLVAKSK